MTRSQYRTKDFAEGGVFPRNFREHPRDEAVWKKALGRGIRRGSRGLFHQSRGDSLTSLSQFHQLIHRELRAIGEFVGKLHRKSGVRGPSVQFTVHKIREPSEEDPGWCHRHEIVAETDPGSLRVASIEPTRDHHAHESPVAGHASPHEIEEAERVPEKLAPVVEQHVAESTSNHNAQDCDDRYEVGNLVLLEFTRTKLHEPPEQQKGGEKSRDVGQAIPANPERLGELDRERIEVVDVCREDRQRH